MNKKQTKVLLKAVKTNYEPKKLLDSVKASKVTDVELFNKVNKPYTQIYKYDTERRRRKKGKGSREELDYVSVREQYELALKEHNLTISDIVGGLNEILKTTKKVSVKLRIYTLLLKTLGLEQPKINISPDNSNNSYLNSQWKIVTASEQFDNNYKTYEFKKYEVNIPQIPMEEKIKENRELEAANSLYGN